MVWFEVRSLRLALLCKLQASSLQRTTRRQVARCLQRRAFTSSHFCVRQAEPLVCEPASRSKVPWCNRNPGMHGDGDFSQRTPAAARTVSGLSHCTRQLQDWMLKPWSLLNSLGFLSLAISGIALFYRLRRTCHLLLVQSP